MKKLLITAALLALGSAANATVFNVELVEFQAGNPGSDAGLWDTTGAVGIPGTDATWTYDDAADTLQASGNFYAGVQPFGPAFIIFAHSMTDVSITAGEASSPTYQCINGPFASSPGVNSNVCGDYDLGFNMIDESTVEYSNGGRDVLVTILGDDVASDPQEPTTIRFMDMSVVQFDGVGGQLILETADWFNDNAGNCEADECDSAGSRMTLNVTSVVPVPAAVWLFGSALGLLGWVRRRATA